MTIQITALPAHDGDCFIIRFGHEPNCQNILIDGGRGVIGIRRLKGEIRKMISKNETIDLLIVTHIDRDHIEGILSLFKDPNIDKKIIKKVWFNSGKNLSEYFKTEDDPKRYIPLSINDSSLISVSQGQTLESQLEGLAVWEPNLIKSLEYHNIGNAIITILSPDLDGLKRLNTIWENEILDDNAKIGAYVDNDHNNTFDELLGNQFIEDKAIPNGSSIAFLFEYEDKKILMLGDSHPSDVLSSLNKLNYTKERKLSADLVKISHHGSKHNTSDSLIEVIECQNYLISTNGISHGLPNKECLARIIKNGDKNKCFFFNYPIIDSIFTKDEQDKNSFQCRYLGSIEYDYLLEV